MTKSEKALIKKAIHLLHHTDNGYDEALAILAKLVGWHASKGRLLGVSIFEAIRIASNPESGKER